MTIRYIPMSGLIDNPKLYSTLRLNLMEGDTLEAQEALYDSGVCYYQDIVQEMKNFHTDEYPTNNLMQYFSLPYDKKREKIIKQKILSAYPTVQAEGNSLYAVLELNMVKDLTVSELHDFTEQIAYQYEYGWGEALEYHNFKTQNSDHITVRLYHSDIKFATGMVFEQWMRKSRARNCRKHPPER